jgi:hypothetical protein
MTRNSINKLIFRAENDGVLNPKKVVFGKTRTITLADIHKLKSLLHKNEDKTKPIFLKAKK